MSSKGYLFLISLGSVFIMLSYLMTNPIYLLLTGVFLIGYGFYGIKKGGK